MQINFHNGFLRQPWPVTVGLCAWLAAVPLRAGDILRGGAAANNLRQTDPSLGAALEAQRQAKASQQDALSKTAQSMNAARAMQAQARALAAKTAADNAGADPNHPGQPLPNVPNGLGVGALQLQGAPVGAKAPVQTQGAGTTNVTIKQTQQQALLNWTTFNVGRNTHLHFDQSLGGANVAQWIAFNRVTDPSGRPSQILGQISADGQVYVINQNGIIFGGSSQVNVRSLVASSLPINDNLIQRGLLNNPDSQFLFSALPIPAGANGTPAFTPPPSVLPEGRRGDVTVQPGAVISSPANADGNGGRIMLVGANVTNSGSLLAPSGQVILAAGLQVGVDAHKSSDASLRGLDVYVGAVSKGNGTATNTGLIEILRGSASISGKVVNQLGAIESSTSVSLNGRIDLLANYNAVPNTGYDPEVASSGTPFLFQATGQVNLGPGSVMRILPEVGSVEKAVGTELALRSQINLQGKTIHLGANSAILAPNAMVSLKAGNWIYNATITPPTSTFIASGGQVYLDRGASINVSGTTGVTAPISQMILSLVLRGGELAPSPLQRDGVLRGPELTVDLRNKGVYNGRAWVGTPLADLTSYLGLIERTVGELTVAGGSVDISAGGSVVLQPGASINVSGGHIEYLGGTIRTSRVWSGGHLVDIKDATPDRVYSGVFTGTSDEVHPRWGITKTYTLPLAPTGEHFEPTTLQGADAGSIALTAPNIAMDGTLTGLVSPGQRQLRSTSNTSEMPQAGQLSFAFSGQEILVGQAVVNYPDPPDVIFGHGSQAPVGEFSINAEGDPSKLPADRRHTVYISPKLTTKQGFGSITIHNEGGNILVPHNVTLRGKPGGTFKFYGSNIGIFGDITAPGGTLEFEALNLTPYDVAVIRAKPEAERLLPKPNVGRGIFTLGAGVTLSTAGLIVDDRLNADAPFTLPAKLAGGSISIKGYSADLGIGSVIDVSGGVLVDPYGKRTYGDGGSIVINAGQDPQLNGIIGGTLTLGASLLGYSGAKGGSLAIQAPLIQVGGFPLHPDTLYLNPDFFSQGGFGSFSLTGLGALDKNGHVIPAVYIAPGTKIQPVSQSLVADLFPQGGGVEMRMVDKPVGLRTPVSLSFLAPGVADGILNAPLIRGDILMGEGSLIRTDPLASVTLSGKTVAVLGSIFAPAGGITIAGAKDSTSIFSDQTQALTTVFIGPHSILSTAGTTLLQPDPYGRKLGTVLPGGYISVTGNILASQGAILDVSGASDWLDFHPAVANPLRNFAIPANSGLTRPPYMLDVERVRVNSSAGAISLTGGQFLFSDATLLGKAGGPTALGGLLNISSGRFYPPGTTVIPPTDSNLVVWQTGATIPSGVINGSNMIGKSVPGPISRGYFAADTFAHGGFDSLSLGGVVEFKGPVDITGRGYLRVADGGVILANDVVRFTAPYVALGRLFGPPVRPEDKTSPFAVPFAPTYGKGSLIVNADLIDIGTLSLQGIGKAYFVANNGDIRGNGTLNMAGNLTLRAGQIYPVTASDFNIIAYDYNKDGVARQGSVTIQASGSRQLPMSAGGSLGIYASRIRQDGVLRAPFGSITLGWDGTGTAPLDLLAGSTVSFPITKSVTLGNGSITSVSAVDPRTGQGILIPYGVSPDGLTWIDPRGVDITADGLPQKSVSVSGQNVKMAKGATIDLRGGGDLVAYRWVEGNGGATDILAADTSYAIVPGYQANFAPYAPYNSMVRDTNLISEFGPGYVNNQIHVGDQIYVQGSRTLRAGIYTLLPARYALLPGSVLVTPQTRTPTGTWELPDGSSLVSGYTFNSLNSDRRVPTIATQFELASGEVVRARAEYETYLANAFLTDAAARLNLSTPLLPKDSGYLLFQGTQSMTLMGNVLSASISGGRGSRVDISSPLDFVINRNGENAAPGFITLGSSVLQAWNAESLIIGGRRSVDDDGRVVLNVTSGSITVDNAGSPLTAADLILASKGNLTLAPGAQIASSGGLSAAPDYYVTGNGTLIRVSGDPDAEVIRTGVSASTVGLTIGAGAQVSGGSITLDSTNVMTIHPTANLSAEVFNINSGRISLVLGQPGPLSANPGLVLTGGLLADLQAARGLSLRSYSSIDLYGAGQIGGAGLQRLSLNAGEIRGFNPHGNAIQFTAGEILLGNSAKATSVVDPLVPGPAADMTAQFTAGIIRLGAGDLAFNDLGHVFLTATNAVVGQGEGRVGAENALTIQTPLLTGRAGSNRIVSAGGKLTVETLGNATSTSSPGLGATLKLTGQETTISSNLIFPSGSLSIAATSGDLKVTGNLDVSGRARTFYDVVRYTNAGEIKLSATAGDVVLAAPSVVNVAGASAGGNAGTLSVSTPQGEFVSEGILSGRGGQGGVNGNFLLDIKALANTSALSNDLTIAGLTNVQHIRVRTGDITIAGTATARDFALTADGGSIAITGRIDASGATGGAIRLAAHGDLTVLDGAKLTVAGKNFDSAGKGGQITLESGTQLNGVLGTGVLDLQTGSVIDLSVASFVAGNETTIGSSAWFGQFAGKLHLRAPQNSAGTDLLINAINSQVVGASSVLAEGSRLFDLTASGGNITAAVQTNIRNAGIAFLGAAGTTTAGYTAMTNRLLANNAPLDSIFVLAPGAEIINRSGNLTLGTASSTTLNDWDLSGFRFGAKRAPGILTMRASGDLVFFNTLSDGFTPFNPANNPPAQNLRLWQGRVTAQNTLLPVNTQSWSYRLTAGADLGASDFASVLTNPGGVGSLILGKAGTSQDAQNNTVPGAENALTRTVVPQRWQVIRTGSGDITISAAKDIQLLNQFATIYSAGTAVADPTMGGNFDVPRPGAPPISGPLGAVQLSPSNPPQYTMGGGNVTLTAGGNIEHLTRNANGDLVADSQLQMPNNWLYRRGTIDPLTGKFAEGRIANDVLSTSWWVDFNNFYQGIGALGGGNVSLTAGGNVSNVDAVTPTNLRVTKGTITNPLAANQSALELGGGDITVRAGGDIDAGVYYVERGRGTLTAGGSIITNATRSVLSPSSIAAGHDSEYTRLPTTLFGGRSSFDVSARGDLVLGPVANAFLLPEGLGNSVWYRSYFSTFGSDTRVNVTSLGGDVTLRTMATKFGEGQGAADPLLYLWMANKQLLGSDTASRAKPWLRLNEATTGEILRYKSLAGIQPGSLHATAYSGDVNLVGNLTLSPSRSGSLSILASGAINALQPNGLVNISGVKTTWSPSIINVSDANPQDIPSFQNPLGYSTALAGEVGVNQPFFFSGINRLFAESGGTNGVLQTKQALHAAGLLHANDSEPIRLYAGTGDISGLTLFSPKFSRVFAGRDISDTSLYIQNVRAGDASIVTSGRDIIPANASSVLRVEANRIGNVINFGAEPLAGDIQISGPGSLQVLAGRTVDLGTVAGNADGTGVGITSIGNARNPYLPFDGANIIAGAGIGGSAGLANSNLDFDSFIATYVQGGNGPIHLAELSSQMGGKTFEQLSPNEQKRTALEVFYLVLRDAGRSQSATTGTPTNGTVGAGYADGFAAIASLFPSVGTGDILTRGRDIRTRNGGDITLFAPGGGLTLANTLIGNPLAPPGIVTESGGNISIFTNGDVDVGIGRIFTLRGGNQIIWSSTGDIAAGSSSKTVKSAPPTRVLIDPQSGAVQTDLAGLATGGGIGVLATVTGVAPGDVDLIAPAGVVDAGDAGIRSSGNLTIAATQVLNAGNITVSGTSSGTPTTVVTTPNIGGLSAASSAAGAGNAAANSAAKATGNQPETAPVQALPSIITVEVLGYGGGEGPEDEAEEARRKKAREAAEAPP